MFIRASAMAVLLAACGAPAEPPGGSNAAVGAIPAPVPLSATAPVSHLVPIWRSPDGGFLGDVEAGGVVIWRAHGDSLMRALVGWDGARDVLLDRADWPTDADGRRYLVQGGSDVLLATPLPRVLALHGPPPGESEWLVGLAPETLAERWRTRVPDRAASFRLGETSLLTNVPNADDVALLDRATGALRWRVDVPELREMNGDRSVVADEGRIFVGGGARIAAFDAETGATLWIRKLDGQHISVHDGRAAAWDRTVALHLLDAATGETLRTIPLHDESVVATVLDEGALYVVRRRHVSAYDVTTGALVWERIQAGADWIGPVRVDADAVYLRTAADNPTVRWSGLVALDRSTGATVWEHPLPMVRTFVLEPPGGLGRIVAEQTFGLVAFGRSAAPPRLRRVTVRGRVDGAGTEAVVRIAHVTTKARDGMFVADVDVPADSASVDVTLVRPLNERSAMEPCSAPVALELSDLGTYDVTLSPSTPGACESSAG